MTRPNPASQSVAADERWSVWTGLPWPWRLFRRQRRWARLNVSPPRKSWTGLVARSRSTDDLSSPIRMQNRHLKSRERSLLCPCVEPRFSNMNITGRRGQNRVARFLSFSFSDQTQRSNCVRHQNTRRRHLHTSHPTPGTQSTSYYITTVVKMSMY